MFTTLGMTLSTASTVASRRTSGSTPRSADAASAPLKKAASARRNIEPLIDQAGFEFWERDVCEPLDAEVDYVFHLASPASPNPASPKSYFAHPIEIRSGLQAGDQVILSDMSAFNASNRLRLE